ncbi:MAG TPA: hypothetical protein VM925_26405 [Labilithrix sp.]|nr:hypothetical protein [Labilithrix sp.]
MFAEARALDGLGPPVRAFIEACHEFYCNEPGLTQGTKAIAAYVDVCRRAADPRELAFWLVQLGRAEAELTLEQELPAALFAEAIELARSVGDLRGEGSDSSGSGRFE